MFYILIIIVVLILVFLDVRKPKNFPEGPFWWPVIGSALSIAKSRRETGMLIKGIKKIADSYPTTADVIGFKVGKDKIVFAVSTESFIEMNTNPDFLGRPYGPFYETRTWNLRRGIVLTDGGFLIEIMNCPTNANIFDILCFSILENSASFCYAAFEIFWLRQ